MYGNRLVENRIGSVERASIASKCDGPFLGRYDESAEPAHDWCRDGWIRLICNEFRVGQADDRQIATENIGRGRLYRSLVPCACARRR